MDADLVDSLLRELREVLASHRTTTVYVTHEFVEALSLAKRVFRMRMSGFTETLISDRRSALRDYFNERLTNIGTMPD